MRRLAVAFVSVAALLSAADIAQARDGCGPGRFYNGYRCAPMGGGYGYGPGPGYGHPPGYYERGPRYGGDAGAGIRIDPRTGRPYCVDKRFTIQDGVCKPYRGG